MQEGSGQVVIALGNALMGDEGVGPRILQELEAPPGVELVDHGTNGFAVLHSISGKRKAVFIDCAYMGKEPGSIQRFRPDEVRDRKVLLPASQHQGDLLQTLDLARTQGLCPGEVVIYGIEPARIEPGLGLTPVLEAKMACLLYTSDAADE